MKTQTLHEQKSLIINLSRLIMSQNPKWTLCDSIGKPITSLVDDLDNHVGILSDKKTLINKGIFGIGKLELRNFWCLIWIKNSMRKATNNHFIMEVFGDDSDIEQSKILGELIEKTLNVEITIIQKSTEPEFEYHFWD